MIRLIIVDDQPMFSEMLAYALGICEGLDVLDTASNGLDSLSLCHTLQPDLVVMDLRMDPWDGIETAERIKAEFPEIRVLLLSAFADTDDIIRAILAGIDGYIVKSAHIPELYRAILDVTAGLKVFDDTAYRSIQHIVANNHLPTMVPRSHRGLFSEMEIQILHLMSIGLNTQGIADQLHLASGTVYNYISRMMARMECTDRVQLVAYALREGIIQ